MCERAYNSLSYSRAFVCAFGIGPFVPPPARTSSLTLSVGFASPRFVALLFRRRRSPSAFYHLPSTVPGRRSSPSFFLLRFFWCPCFRWVPGLGSSRDDYYSSDRGGDSYDSRGGGRYGGRGGGYRYCAFFSCRLLCGKEDVLAPSAVLSFSFSFLLLFFFFF